jgi:hypothetical protein
MLGNIIRIVNPVKTPDTALNAVMEALSVGLAFIPGLEGGLGQLLFKAA